MVSLGKLLPSVFLGTPPLNVVRVILHFYVPVVPRRSYSLPGIALAPLGTARFPPPRSSGHVLWYCFSEILFAVFPPILIFSVLAFLSSPSLVEGCLSLLVRALGHPSSRPATPLAPANPPPTTLTFHASSLVPHLVELVFQNVTFLSSPNLCGERVFSLPPRLFTQIPTRRLPFAHEIPSPTLPCSTTTPVSIQGQAFTWSYTARMDQTIYFLYHRPRPLIKCPPLDGNAFPLFKSLPPCSQPSQRPFSPLRSGNHCGPSTPE